MIVFKRHQFVFCSILFKYFFLSLVVFECRLLVGCIYTLQVYSMVCGQSAGSRTIVLNTIVSTHSFILLLMGIYGNRDVRLQFSYDK